MTDNSEVPTAPNHVDAEGTCENHPDAQLGKQRGAGMTWIFCPRCAVQGNETEVDES